MVARELNGFSSSNPPPRRVGRPRSPIRPLSFPGRRGRSLRTALTKDDTCAHRAARPRPLPLRMGFRRCARD